MLMRFGVKPTPISAIPPPMAERAMVFLWSSLEDTNPEHNKEIKYPDADIKKKDPAWSRLRFMSSDMVGSRGEIIILMVKFRKKMEVKKNRGKS